MNSSAPSRGGWFTYENGVLLLLGLTFGFLFFDRNAAGNLVPFITNDLKLNNTQIGLVTSALSLTWAISAYAFGAWSDRIGVRKPFLLASVLSFSLCSFMSGIAQSFGVLDVDLSKIQPDFYSGSAHKWPCGPRENGVLYVRAAVLERIFPSVISLYGGAAAASRRLEANGQRDEAAMIAFGEAIALQKDVGMARIESRVRLLARTLADGLRKIDGVKVWTSPEPDRSAAIVSFQPASLDIRRLNTALYEKDRIICATRGGADRGGLRFSPHFYNSMKEIERTIDAIGRYVKTGV